MMIYLFARNANEVIIVGALVFHSKLLQRIGIARDVLSATAIMASKRETFTH